MLHSLNLLATSFVLAVPCLVPLLLVVHIRIRVLEPSEEESAEATREFDVQISLEDLGSMLTMTNTCMMEVTRLP